MAAAFSTDSDKNNDSMRSSASLLQFAPLQKETLPRRIVFGSCASQTEDLTYWDRIVSASPDLVILMGDNVYGSQGLKEAYVTLGSHPSFQRAAQSVPIIATLDDNDYRHPDGKDAAKDLFLNFFQIPGSDVRWNRPQGGVYTSYSWANQLQIILLDVRCSKSPFLRQQHGNIRGPFRPDCDTVADNDQSSCNQKTMLGEEQWQWLEEQLLLEHTSMPSVELRMIISPIQVLAEGHGWDCWNLFPRERDRLLSLLMLPKPPTTTTTSSSAETNTTTKTILMSGDRHVAGFYQKNGLFEVTSSSLTHSVPNDGRLDHEVDPTRIGDLVHINNFGLLEIDWEENQVEVSIRRADNGERVGEEWTRRI